MDRASQILIFFMMAVIAALFFLARTFNLTFSSQLPFSITKTETESALRGAIITADGYHIARSYKTYTVAIDPRVIPTEKKGLFIRLFAIYSRMDEQVIAAALASDPKRVILLKNADAKTAKHLKELSRNLYKERVFSPQNIGTGRRVVLKGLEITENEFIRSYPYGSMLEPLLGYVRKDTLAGIVGIEKSYNNYLLPRQDASLAGMRDAGGNIILTKKSSITQHRDGYNVKLGIEMRLQKGLEEELTATRQHLHADEVIAAVMESGTGRIIALASSNRYTPDHIESTDIPYIKLGMIQYVFEPGSIIKPLIFAWLMEKGKVAPGDLLNGYSGKYTIGTKVITDEHKMNLMSAEEAIIFSSNIGMAQLSQRLGAQEYLEGLLAFGLSQKSGVDLPYEYGGDIPTLWQLNSEIYKATTSYGYGMRANFMQLLKAYNILNNDGLMLEPYLVEALEDERGTTKIPHPEGRRVLSSATVASMQSILRKTVTNGTGQKADIEGVFIGGKTGTAHIARAGHYENLYNSSFFGFANDTKRHYTIGVVVINPRTSHFAAETAVPLFRTTVERMGKLGMIFIPPLPEGDLAAAKPH